MTSIDADVPSFAVRLRPPDLRRWFRGNTGVPGFTTFESGRAGPHAAVIALVHGNEFAGAIVLDRLLQEKIRPLSGRLTLGFANIAAFERFDVAHPTATRFLEEDMNRLWDPAILDGPRHSLELNRAREIRPLIDSVDLLLDLHSMLWPSDPLLLSGRSEKGRAFAGAIGSPDLIVADAGHLSGNRLIDYCHFVQPERQSAAVLVEAGQHWEEGTVATTLESVGAMLRNSVGIPASGSLPHPVRRRTPRYAEVTHVITAVSPAFTFVRPFRGGEVIRHQDTLIAVDGDLEIRTPHDECLLVMPSLRPSRGHTAVRLARFVQEPGTSRPG